MQAKLNLYDFYNVVMQKTDNSGRTKVKVCQSVGSVRHMPYNSLTVQVS